MKQEPRNYGSLLHQIAATHGCTELAAFDVERGADQMRSLYHVTGLKEDQPERKNAAIEAFKEIIARHCLPSGSDAAILVESSAPEQQFCLVTLARRAGKVVGAAAFIKRFDDEEAANAALNQIRSEAEAFRDGPPSQDAG